MAIAPEGPATGRSGHRRVVLMAVGVGAAVLVAIAIVALIRSTDESGSAAGSAPVDRPEPPPVPSGWKPVVFESVQFAVPEDWPVVTDPTCDDLSTEGAYLITLSQPRCNPDHDSVFAVSALVSFLEPAMEIETVRAAATRVDTTTPEEARPRLETVNGLRAVVTMRDNPGIAGTAAVYTVRLLDEDVVIYLLFTDPADTDTARRIVTSIGAAPGSIAPPKTPRPFIEPPVDPDDVSVEPDAVEYCRASQELSDARLTAPPTGEVSVEALAYLDRMIEAAPDELRPPLATVRTWVASGAPEPRPHEVGEAQLQMDYDELVTCQGYRVRSP